MTVYELVEKLGGEIVRGQARIRQGRDYVILGRLNGDTMEFTEEGRALAAPAEEPAKKTRKAKQPEVVEEKLDIDDNIQLDLD
jgi:hypothetical protein